MYLMNGNRVVLQFSLDDLYIKVLDNTFLPYGLKDFVKDTDISSPMKIKESMKYITWLKDYLCGRTLNLSRDNAKAILHTMSLPQSMKTDEKLKIVFFCDALTMTDNFWIKSEEDTRCFDQVNLRNNHLADAAYDISILGKEISATKEIMQPDIGTNGMFAKTWVRTPKGIKLWKTDKTSESVNAVAEKNVSDILDHTNVQHVQYSIFEKNGKKITECDCLANDDYSLVDGYELKDWCYHTGTTLLSFLEENFLEDFSKMCVLDYVLANTDRHLGNINFVIDNSSNEIIGMAPLFDHNQALVSDWMGVDVSTLEYEVTGISIRNSALKYYKSSNIEIDEMSLPEKCKKRFDDVVKNNMLLKENLQIEKMNVVRK